MSSHYIDPNRSSKTAGQYVQDMVIFMVAMGIIAFIFDMIAKILVAPFKVLFMSDAEKLNEKIKKSTDKVDARIARRKDIAEDPNDMLNQYVKRFVTNRSEYAKDSGSVSFKAWFDSFKKGLVLDSSLRWAPELYSEGSVTGEFLDYLSNQVELHKSKFGDQIKLIKTISAYYPEFTSRFSMLSTEIEGFRERAKATALKAELQNAIVKKGISEEVAAELMSRNLSLEELKLILPKAVKCSRKGYSTAFCLFCIDRNLDPSSLTESLKGVPEKARDSYSQAIDSLFDTVGDSDVIMAIVENGTEGIIRYTKALEKCITKHNTEKAALVKEIKNSFREDCFELSTGGTHA